MQMFAPASRRVNLSEMHTQNEQEEGSVSMELTGMIDATANIASELFAINQDTMAIFEVFVLFYLIPKIPSIISYLLKQLLLLNLTPLIFL